MVDTVNGVVSSFRFKNVLHVLLLHRNLISVSQLTANKVAIVHVRDECKMISNHGHGKLLMTGSKRDNLWYLNINTQVGSSNAFVVASTDVLRPSINKASMMH